MKCKRTSLLDLPNCIGQHNNCVKQSSSYSLLYRRTKNHTAIHCIRVHNIMLFIDGCWWTATNKLIYGKHYKIIFELLINEKVKSFINISIFELIRYSSLSNFHAYCCVVMLTMITDPLCLRSSFRKIFDLKFERLVQCLQEICIPIEKCEVKQLFHGWPNEAVFEGGTSGIFRQVCCEIRYSRV